MKGGSLYQCLDYHGKLGAPQQDLHSLPSARMTRDPSQSPPDTPDPHKSHYNKTKD